MKTLFAILLTLLLLANASPCTVSVVGSGLSGVYTAYRLSTAEDSVYSPNEICLFESSDRIGGRLLSIDDSEGGEVLEMGIENFDTGKMPLFTELVEFLGVKSDCVVEKTVSTETEIATEDPYLVVTTAEVAWNEVNTATTTEAASYDANTVLYTEAATFESNSQSNTEAVPSGRGKRAVNQQQQTIIGTEGQNTYLVTTVEEEAPSGLEQSSEQSANTQGQTTMEPQGFVSETEVKEECGRGTDIKKLFFIRNQIIQPGEENAENMPFQLSQSLEKIKTLPDEAFKAVLEEHIAIEELEALKDEQDPAVRWEKVSSMIKELTESNVTYNGVPIHELNLRMVLADTLDLSDEDIEAAIYLSDRFPRLRTLMSMNFELFAIQYMRNIAAGEGEFRRISGLGGLRTILEILATEMKEKGVQIYLNSKLDDAHITDSGTIVMHFANLDNVVVSERVFLALNRKNLMSLTGSDFIEKISPEVSDLLGSIQSLNMIKGVVFYNNSWWRDYDLSGELHTDTGFNKLSYHTKEDCAEEDVCPGWIRFEHWGTTGEELNYDIVNPVGIATVLSAYLSEGEGSESSTEKPVVVEETTAEKPVLVEETTAEKPVLVEETTAEKPVLVEETTAEKPVLVEETTAEKPVVVEETTAVKPVVVEETSGTRGKRQNQPEETVVSEKPIEGEGEDEQSKFEELSEREKVRSKIVLELIHRSIMNIHKKIPNFDAEAIESPSAAWVANWKTDGVFNFGAIRVPSTVPYKDSVSFLLEPIPGAPVHFINSDFSEFTDWDHSLESSIVQSERALYLILGMEKPEFLEETIYTAVVEV